MGRVGFRRMCADQLNQRADGGSDLRRGVRVAPWAGLHACAQRGGDMQERAACVALQQAVRLQPRAGTQSEQRPASVHACTAGASMLVQQAVGEQALIRAGARQRRDGASAHAGMVRRRERWCYTYSSGIWIFHM